MASALLSKLSEFTNPQDPGPLQELDAAIADALAAGLSQSDKAALLQVFERFRDEDGFGVFWSILHGLEAADNYEHELVASVRRAPNLFNTLMVNRIVNAGAAVVANVPAEQLLNEVLQTLQQLLSSSNRSRASCIATWARGEVRPNPSLEWTRSGMALGPRDGCSYHPSRGPSAMPARAPQLKR